MRLRRVMTPLMLAVAMMVTMGVANASLQLTLTSGAATTGPITTAACPGGTCFVNFTGAVGAWNLNVTTGFGPGSQVGPTLDVTSNNTTSAGAADDLVIRLVADGLTLAPGYTGMIDGNGTIASILYQAFWGTSLASTPNLIGSTGTLIPGPSYHGAFSGAAGAGSALAMVLTLHSPSPGSTSFDAALTPVPEPASVVLLGGMLLCTVSAIRRKIGSRA